MNKDGKLSKQYQYMLSFIYDSTKFNICFALNAKHEIPKSYQRYLAFIRNQFDLSINVMHTDRGGEYVNGNIKKIYDEKGITQ